MAKKVDSDTQGDQTNTIDPIRLKKEFGRIEEALAKKLSHKMKYVESCKPINEAVSNAYEIASQAAGVPVKVLKAKIRERDLYRKIEGIAADMDDEVRDTFEMVSQALGDFGDLPLGQAAKDRAASRESGEQPVKSQNGRPRKAPSPDASAAAGDASADGQPVDISGLDPRAVAETEDHTYQRGHEAGLSGIGCLVPTELCGINRDRWHAGWLAGNEKRNDGPVGDNVDRINAGISPLH